MFVKTENVIALFLLGPRTYHLKRVCGHSAASPRPWPRCNQKTATSTAQNGTNCRIRPGRRNCRIRPGRLDQRLAAHKPNSPRAQGHIVLVFIDRTGIMLPRKPTSKRKLIVGNRWKLLEEAEEDRAVIMSTQISSSYALQLTNATHCRYLSNARACTRRLFVKLWRRSAQRARGWVCLYRVQV